MAIDPATDRNLLTMRYGREDLTIRKVPCPHCSKCSHVEAVVITISGEEAQTLTASAADVVWDLAQTQAYHSRKY
jgi:hypothetical protein